MFHGGSEDCKRSFISRIYVCVLFVCDCGVCVCVHAGSEGKMVARCSKARCSPSPPSTLEAQRDGRDTFSCVCATVVCMSICVGSDDGSEGKMVVSLLGSALLIKFSKFLRTRWSRQWETVLVHVRGGDVGRESWFC